MRILIFLIASLLSFNLLAAEDFYSFENKSQQQTFEQLTSHLRCLVCQNQDIAQSNASLALDLRNQIYTQLKSGKTKDDILSYLVSRYGDFILYQPPFQVNTLLLWCTPFVFLLAGLAYLFYYIRRGGRSC